MCATHADGWKGFSFFSSSSSSCSTPRVWRDEAEPNAAAAAACTVRIDVSCMCVCSHKGRTDGRTVKGERWFVFIFYMALINPCNLTSSYAEWKRERERESHPFTLSLFLSWVFLVRDCAHELWMTSCCCSNDPQPNGLVTVFSSTVCHRL